MRIINVSPRKKYKLTNKVYAFEVEDMKKLISSIKSKGLKDPYYLKMIKGVDNDLIETIGGIKIIS